MRPSAARGIPLLVGLLAACFERRPGTDRAPLDAGAAVTLRPTQPAHGAVVTRRRPLVRWTASRPSRSWSVEFCADLRCRRVLQRASASEPAAAPPADLPTGLVFWRVSDPTLGAVTSPVRWFFVPHGAAQGAPPGPGSVASPAQFDADADGLAETLDPDGTLRHASDGAVVARLARDGIESVIAAGDVDGDGAPDLAGIDPGTATVVPSLVLWRGPVQGDAVAPSWRLPIAGGAPPLLLTAGDLDGDGLRDLVVSSPSFDDRRGRVYVVRGSERSPPSEPPAVLDSPRGSGGFFYATATGDVDGDGCDELLAAATAPGAQAASVALVYRGTPLGLDPAPVWSVERSASDNDGRGSAGALVDVDGDGALDAVLSAPGARRVGCVYTFPWREAARSLAADPSSTACAEGGRGPGNWGGVIAVADFDGDGHADLAAVEQGASTDALWLTPGDRAGLHEGPPVEFSDSLGAGNVRRIFPAELDGDGYADLVVEVFAGGSASPTLRFHGSPAGLRR